MRLKIIILSFLLISVKTSFAQIRVTSNADSGPGTLREALQTAASNGTVGTDQIHFDLPGNAVSDRTIRLRSALPLVTSNVIIDGSTQPGVSLGVSGAKVIIEPENSPANFSALVVGAFSNQSVPTSNVEIYGLYIRRFANITNLNSVNTSQGSGIILDYRLQNIIIGKAGKGNVICGNVNGIWMRNTSNSFAATATSSISIQGNMIGVMDDGTTEFTNQIGISLETSEYNISIGGDNSGEGNVIAANATNILINKGNNYSFRSGVNIINNKIGTDYTGQKDYKNLPIFLASSSLEMYGVRINAINTDVNIHKNVISGQRSWAVAISNADFTITGNYIGSSQNGISDLGNNGGIRLETGSQGTIGGAAAADVNYIGFNRFGVESVSAKPIKISRNSFFCNTSFGIGKTLSATQAYVQVLKRKVDLIEGKASPNAEIELFYTDNCAGSCQGKTYIAAVRAGNDGRWSYSGPLNGQVTATATLATSTTSMFADAGLLDNEAVVNPVTCNGNGSITISEPREGIDFKWYKLEDDGSAGLIASTQSVSNLLVGTYEVRIFDGCKTTSHKFFITDQVLTKPIIIAPSPACSQTIFQFSATVLRGKGSLIFQWLNASNAIVGTGVSVSLPQGTYRVKVTDDAGCTLTSDPVTIVNRPAPIINLGSMYVKSAACGKIDGAITGITVTPAVGTATYRWLKLVPTQPSVEVAQTLQLTNVDGGNYMLEVTDQSTCSPILSSTINIPITNSVIISQGNTTRTTCNKNNGAVRNITISDANSYEWSGPTGILESGTYTGVPLSFENLPAGTYRLTAKSTITGCSNFRDYTVDQIVAFPFTASNTVNNATCGLNNGSIALTYSSQQPQNFNWKNGQGIVMVGASATSLTNLAPGTYTLFAYDSNNCETIIGPFVIANTPLLTIVPNTGTVINDGCGLKRGSVKGLQVLGGVPEYSYKWVDKNSVAVQFSKDLIDVGAGEYRLIVTDRTTCGTFTSDVYTVADFPFSISTPIVSNIRVCYITDIMVTVKNKDEGKYQLFRDDQNTTPFLESENGTFSFKVSKTANYHIKHVLGNCESTISTFNVEVINDNLEISNTMTPNGDGMNDLWVVKGLPDSKLTLIQLYSRSGQLVYESRGGYEKPFDGSFRGVNLPAGVYYYNIDLKADCKPIAGSLTILR